MEIFRECGRLITGTGSLLISVLGGFSLSPPLFSSPLLSSPPLPYPSSLPSPLFLFLLKKNRYFYYCCYYMCSCAHARGCLQKPEEGARWPGVRVSGSREPPSIGAGNQTQVSGKSSAPSRLLSHLLSPTFSLPF